MISESNSFLALVEVLSQPEKYKAQAEALKAAAEKAQEAEAKLVEAKKATEAAHEDLKNERGVLEKQAVDVKRKAEAAAREAEATTVYKQRTAKEAAELLASAREAAKKVTDEANDGVTRADAQLKDLRQQLETVSRELVGKQGKLDQVLEQLEILKSKVA